MTRLILIEDDDGTREALEAALSISGFDVVGSFSRGRAALEALPRCAPEVALVDLGLPEMSGAETIRALRGASPELLVLVLTVFEDAERVVDAVMAGANGYLLKGSSIEQIRAALQNVRDGLAPISPGVARHLLSRVRAEPASVPDERLSPREQQVLELLSRGHTYADIAEALDIRLGTVQTYVKHIYRKLEVASKAEAARVSLLRERK